jgi:integral membrane sensor domain MASE1
MEASAHVLERRRVLAMFVLFAVYFLTARIGLSVSSVNTFAALIWPPTGVAIAALLVYGKELWPGVALGAFLVNLSMGAPFVGALGACIGNTAEAYLFVRILQHTGFSQSFGDIRAALTFVACSLFAPIVSATIGVGSLAFTGAITSSAFPATWGTWWSGDVLSALIFAPLLITWFGKGRSAIPQVSYFETYCMVLVAIGLSFFIFWNSYTDVMDPPFLYIVILPLFWSTLRLGPRGKTSVLFIISIISTAGTIAGKGPFANVDVISGLVSQQFFIGAMAVTFLIFASVIEERAQARNELEDYANQLEVALQKIREGQRPAVPEATLAQD